MLMRRGAIGALICALALACAPGWAATAPGVLTGEVIAGESIPVYATSAALVESVNALVGQQVSAGEALVTLSTERVYAHSDGVVASVSSAPGDAVDGAVLSVAPVSQYSIYCTVEDAYEQPENMLLHAGQTIYAKCTRDGSHRAVARVTAIDGEHFTLEALGGELYIGETVYLYLSDEFESDQRVGIGTVVDSAVSEYAASGTLTRVCVAPGDAVERGQLLYEYLPGSATQPGAGDAITAADDGIVLDISAQAGQALDEGAMVAEIAPLDGLRISVYVDEVDAAAIAAGDAVTLTLPWQEEEEAFAGTVESVSRAAADSATQTATDAAGATGTATAGDALSGAGDSANAGGALTASGSADTGRASDSQAISGESLYEVRILPAELDGLRIGMSVTVYFGD